MPKIIENGKARLLEEARRQVQELGYSAMTVRSVAVACGLGVGTVYNYFPSKDALVASFMLEDWQDCMAAINAAARDADGPAPVVRSICGQVAGFSARHAALFRDQGAIRSFTAAFHQYHGQFRASLAAPLARFFPGGSFLPEFIAEALLTWTMEGKGYEDMEPVFCKLYERCDAS